MTFQAGAKTKIAWLSLSVAAIVLAVVRWASPALAEEGLVQQQEVPQFRAWAHSLEASAGEVRIGATFENRSGSPAQVNLLLDIETDDDDERVVFHHIVGDELMAPGTPYALGAFWTPQEPGAYTVKLGVFSADWSTVYAWVNDAAGITRTDDGAGSEGWLLDVGDSSSFSQTSTSSHVSSQQTTSSHVTQSSSSSQVSSSSVSQSSSVNASSGAASEDEIKEEVRKRLEDALERAEEARRTADEILRDALGHHQ